MILSIFSGLYELFIGKNQDVSEYAEIFNYVGLISLLFTLLFCAVFYFVLGKRLPLFHKLSHWLISLLIVALFSFLFAYFHCDDVLGGTDSYAVQFSIINAVYFSLLFFILSIIARRYSVFAKHTPF